MMPATRIGAVSYLNTKPLVFGLQQRLPDAEILFDLPSRLADQLGRGELDIALIPTMEYFQNPEYEIVSDACIACRGPVLSVKLLSRCPLADVRTLALDEGSRTSVALARILLKHQFGLAPRLQPLPIGCGVGDTDADAILLIGDRAIHPPQDRFVVEWDLGDQWCRWSRLPFVFAMWTARTGVGTPRIAEALAAARDEGVAELNQIARREADVVGLSHERCLAYLRDNLYFYLGDREQAGLERFRDEAVQLELAPAPLP